MKALPKFYDARDAMRAACASAPSVIGHKNGHGFTIYCPKAPPNGFKPLMLAFHRSKLPLPLNEDGLEVFVSALRAEMVLRMTPKKKANSKSRRV